MSQAPAFAAIADSSRIGSQLLSKILSPLVSTQTIPPGDDLITLFHTAQAPRVLLVNHDWPALNETLPQLAALPTAPQVILLAGHDNLDTLRAQFSSTAYFDILERPFEAKDVVNMLVRCLSSLPDTSANANGAVETIDSGKPLSSVLTRDMAFCNRHGLVLSVMAVQLNSYQSLCADVGRDAVEHAQQTLELKMSEILRSEDGVCLRQPGLILLSLPGTPPLGARVLAHRICSWLSGEEFTQQYFSIHFSVNIGIHCCVPGNQADAQELMSETSFTAQQPPEDDQNRIHLSDYAQTVIGEVATPASRKPLNNTDDYWGALDEILSLPQISDPSQQGELLKKLSPLLLGLSESQRLKLVDDLLMGSSSMDG